MTLPDYRRFARYWERHPPTHLLLAALLGLGPKKASAGPTDLSGLLALAPGGLMTAGKTGGG